MLTLIQFLKTLWKYRFWVLLLCFFVVCGIGSYYFNKLQHAKQVHKEVLYSLDSTKQETRFYKNEYSKQVAFNQNVEMSLEALKDLQKANKLEFLKQFEGLKKNLKNLESATQIESKIEGTAKAILKDTIIKEYHPIENVKHFRYVDNETFIKGIVIKDSVFLDYRMNMNLDVVVLWERKWFLGKKQYKVQATSRSEKVDILKLHSFTVKKSTK
jgi:hypothetical protein